MGVAMRGSFFHWGDHYHPGQPPLIVPEYTHYSHNDFGQEMRNPIKGCPRGASEYQTIRKTLLMPKLFRVRLWRRRAAWLKIRMHKYYIAWNHTKIYSIWYTCTSSSGMKVKTQRTNHLITFRSKLYAQNCWSINHSKICLQWFIDLDSIYSHVMYWASLSKMVANIIYSRPAAEEFPLIVTKQCSSRTTFIYIYIYITKLLFHF